MYMITPSDQISQLLSYFSGPNTSGANKQKMRKINSSSLSTLIIVPWNMQTYRHNKVCNMASVMCLLNMSL